MAATDIEETKTTQVVEEKQVEHGQNLKTDLRPSHYNMLFGFEANDPRAFADEKCNKPWTEATTEEVNEFLKKVDKKGMELFGSFPIPDVEGVKHTLYEAGTDGLLCDVTVTEPINRGDEPLVGMVYMHGGGFCLFTGKEKMMLCGNAYQAKCGAVVMSIHYSKTQEKPFPGAQIECEAALRWFHGKIEEFNMVRDAGFCLYGESAGGNLVIACTLNLIEAGDGHIVSSIDASCPALHPWSVDPDHVGGIPEAMLEAQRKYCHPHSKFPPHLEYSASWMSYGYAGSLENLTNGKCWPHFADDELLKQLPPIIIQTNECDVLEPEAKMMIRRLDGLGVKVKGISHTGTYHSSEIFDMAFPFSHHLRFQLAKTYCVAPVVEPEEEKADVEPQN